MFFSCRIFMFWSQPYINPWVDTMYRAGSVHNIGLLGLSAIDRVQRAKGTREEGLGLEMLIWSSLYMLFVVFLFTATVIVPILKMLVAIAIVGRQMKRVGMRTVDLSSLFLNPLLHDSTILSEDEMEVAYDAHDVSPESSVDEEAERRDIDADLQYAQAQASEQEKLAKERKAEEMQRTYQETTEEERVRKQQVAATKAAQRDALEL